MSPSPLQFWVQPGLLSLTLNPGAPLMLVRVRALIVATRHFKYSSKALGLAAWMEEKDVGTEFSQDLPSQVNVFITCFKNNQPQIVPLFIAGVLCSTSARTSQGPTSGRVQVKECSSALP